MCCGLHLSVRGLTLSSPLFLARVRDLGEAASPVHLRPVRKQPLDLAA